jgi:uncharacterized protein YjbJ (UPF0337 family)
MLEQLKRPFKKRYDKVREKASQYVGPVKESVSKLMAMLPKMEAFAGLEDQAEPSADGAVVEAEGAAKPDLKARLKEFKASLKGLTDFQKLILLTIAVVLPAGIFIAVVLAGIFHRHRK